MRLIESLKVLIAALVSFVRGMFSRKLLPPAVEVTAGPATPPVPDPPATPGPPAEPVMSTDPLWVDIYPGDGRGPEDVRRLALAGTPWHGIWFKASEGLSFRAPSWFNSVWRVANGMDDERIRARLGVDWWVSAYHYLHANRNGAMQAEYFAKQIEEAGGWTEGTAYPVVDVEEGTNEALGASAQQIIDVTSRYAERLRQISGREVVLYCGWWLRQKFLQAGVKSRMACKYMIPAAYTPTLNPASVTDIGFNFPDEMFGWQYNGDGTGFLKNYPQTTPLGPEDISAITIAGGGAKAIAHLRNQKWRKIP